MWFYERLYPDVRIGIKGERIFRKKTIFQKMEVYQTDRYGKMLTLDDVVQTTEKDEFIYHEMLTHPVLFLHPRPQKVLIIGGGDGGALREVLKHPVTKVCLVEIDEAVVKISKKYLPKICQRAFEDKRLNLIIDDGAKFVRMTKERFDIIIVDSTDPIGAAKTLFSRKFYTQLYSVLTQRGMIIRQTGSTTIQQDEVRSNYKLAKQIFPFVAIHVVAVPTYIGGFFSLLVASKKIDPGKASLKYIEKKFRALQLRTKYYNPQVHIGSLYIPTYVSNLQK
jgi:spermidine synthase